MQHASSLPADRNKNGPANESALAEVDARAGAANKETTQSPTYNEVEIEREGEREIQRDCKETYLCPFFVAHSNSRLSLPLMIQLVHSSNVLLSVPHLLLVNNNLKICSEQTSQLATWKRLQLAVLSELDHEWL